MVPSGIVRSHVTLVESTSKQHDPLVPSRWRPDQSQARSRARFASVSVRVCVCVVTCCPKKSEMLATSVFCHVQNQKVSIGKTQSCVFQCVMGARTVAGRTDTPGVDGEQVGNERDVECQRAQVRRYFFGFGYLVLNWTHLF